MHTKDYGYRQFRSEPQRIEVHRRIDVSGFRDYQNVVFERTVRLVKDLTLQAEAILPSGRVIGSSSTYCEYGRDGLASLDSILEYATGEEGVEYRAMGCSISVKATIRRRYEDCLRELEFGRSGKEVDVFAPVPFDWKRQDGTSLSPSDLEFDDCIFVFGAEPDENRTRRDQFVDVLASGTMLEAPDGRAQLEVGFKRLDRLTESA